MSTNALSENIWSIVEYFDLKPALFSFIMLISQYFFNLSLKIDVKSFPTQLNKVMPR